MSHSTVLVIGEDPEAMLAPYSEELEVEPYRRYEDVNSPQEHWLFDKLVAEQGLAADAGWAAFVAARSERYPGDDERYFLDEEMDRVYQLSTYNPLSRWDWYQLGGRWTGYFDLRPGATGQVGEPGLMTSRARGRRVDQARKRDIDFGAMRERHAADARREIREVLAVLKDQPPLMPWARYCDEWPDDIDAARRAYHVQPALKALYEAKLYADDPADFFCLRSAEPETAYVARAARTRSTPFAVLTEQGWAEKGHMGWFGIVHDEADPDDWADRAQSLIDAAPDDALFSLYDVHI
jgi:hypothetical protein